MLTDMLSRISRSGIWRAAGHAELPLLVRDGGALPNQLLLLAGGLALTLSRCCPEDQGRHYPRAAQLYALLRRELRQHGKTTASSSLILDAFHETSEHLDPNSRQAFHKCLDARVQYERLDAATREANTASDQLFTSFMPMSDDPLSLAAHPSTKRSSRHR